MILKKIGSSFLLTVLLIFAIALSAHFVKKLQKVTIIDEWEGPATIVMMDDEYFIFPQENILETVPDWVMKSCNNLLLKGTFSTSWSGRGKWILSNKGVKAIPLQKKEIFPFLFNPEFDSPKKPKNPLEGWA